MKTRHPFNIFHIKSDLRKVNLSVAFPVLTVEQRTASLSRAIEVRKLRSELLASVRSGKMTVPELFVRSSVDEVVRKTKVFTLIHALPGFSAESATALIENLCIPDSRRVGGLNRFQREALIAALVDP